MNFSKILYALNIGLIFSAFTPAFAAKCSSLSVDKTAKEFLQELLGDPVDLSGISRFPFLGLVEKSTCSAGQTTFCETVEVVFKVEDQFFDPSVVLYEILGRQAKKIKQVSVNMFMFDKVSRIEFPYGSKWFVVPENFGSRGENGSGFVFNPSCGSSLAKYSDGKLILFSGEVIPYENLKRDLQGMVTPKALERLRHEMEKIVSESPP